MQPSATENGAYDYTRSGNPTRDALEKYALAYTAHHVWSLLTFLGLVWLCDRNWYGHVATHLVTILCQTGCLWPLCCYCLMSCRSAVVSPADLSGCRLLARVEGAERALTFSTGMAALTTVTHLLEAGNFSSWQAIAWVAKFGHFVPQLCV